MKFYVFSPTRRFTKRQLWKQLWAGCLLCGFFWEFWNYYSSPKWIYEVPFVDFWHLFEMPLLGYLGYLPFALELYALYAMLSAWLPADKLVLSGKVLEATPATAHSERSR